MDKRKILAKREAYEKADKIIEIVLDFYGDKKIRIDSRKQEYVRTRFIIIRLIHTFTELSSTDISELIGYANHTTVLHALKSAENAIATNDPLYKHYFVLLRKIKGRLRLYDMKVKYLKINYCELN